jgi:hypothetical protein
MILYCCRLTTPEGEPCPETSETVEMERSPARPGAPPIVISAGPFENMFRHARDVHGIPLGDLQGSQRRSFHVDPLVEAGQAPPEAAVIAEGTVQHVLPDGRLWLEEVQPAPQRGPQPSFVQKLAQGVREPEPKKEG